MTLTDAWFLVSRDVRQHGHAAARWLGDAFIELEAELEGEHVWHFVLGHSDANEELVALYHHPRPTSRLYHMTFTGNDWNHGSIRFDGETVSQIAEGTPLQRFSSECWTAGCATCSA